MPRPVECLLVGAGGHASEDAIAEMTQLVRQRFGKEPNTLRGAQATKDAVLAAFDEVARRSQNQEILFILLFSGHGGFNQQVHSWKLQASSLEDSLIVEKLRALHCNSRVFLVSDCCYGAQLLHKRGDGDHEDLPTDFVPSIEITNTQQRILKARLHAFVGSASKELRECGVGANDKMRARGHVVLAAASDWLLIRHMPRQSEFVRTLCKALQTAQTYGALRSEMLRCTNPDSQCNWIVEAVPENALENKPLD